MKMVIQRLVFGLGLHEAPHIGDISEKEPSCSLCLAFFVSIFVQILPPRSSHYFLEDYHKKCRAWAHQLCRTGNRGSCRFGCRVRVPSSAYGRSHLIVDHRIFPGYSQSTSNIYVPSIHCSAQCAAIPAVAGLYSPM